jgi:hypothetical protein
MLLEIIGRFGWVELEDKSHRDILAAINLFPAHRERRCDE